jgi:hypothetical protein
MNGGIKQTKEYTKSNETQAPKLLRYIAFQRFIDTRVLDNFKNIRRYYEITKALFCDIYRLSIIRV